MHSLSNLRGRAEYHERSLQAIKSLISESLKNDSIIIEDCCQKVREKWLSRSTIQHVIYPLNMTPCHVDRKTVHTISLQNDSTPDCQDCRCHKMLSSILSSLKNDIPVLMASWSGEDHWYGHISVSIDHNLNKLSLSEIRSDDDFTNTIRNSFSPRHQRLLINDEHHVCRIKIYSTMSLEIDLIIFKKSSFLKTKILGVLSDQGLEAFWDSMAKSPIDMYSKAGRVFNSINEIDGAIDLLREAFLNYEIKASDRFQ